MRRALLALALLAGPWLLPSHAAEAGCGLGTRHKGVTAYRSSDIRTASVVLYGDSITYQVTERLRIRHPEIAVDAFWGRSAQSGVEALARDTFDNPAPEVVVMAVGTNDTREPSVVGDQVRFARGILPRSTRLLWVNTYVESRPGSDEVNRQIALVPGVEVVDWSARNLRARGHAERSPLLSDGVHLSCGGSDAWVRLVEAALHHRALGLLAPYSDQAAEARYP